MYWRQEFGYWHDPRQIRSVCAFAKRGPRSSVSVATQWSHERIGEKILILAEKAAVDCGFDLEPRRYGRVICFTSTRHPAAVYLRLAEDRKSVV